LYTYKNLIVLKPLDRSGLERKMTEENIDCIKYYYNVHKDTMSLFGLFFLGRGVGNNTERGGESVLSDQYNFSLSILRFICDATSIYPVNILFR